MRVKRSTVEDDPREGVKETRRKVRKWARHGPRRSDGKQQPQLTSHAHGARTNGLFLEADRPGEDDKSNVVGRKRGQQRGASGQQLEPEWIVTQPQRWKDDQGEGVPKHQGIRL